MTGSSSVLHNKFRWRSDFLSIAFRRNLKIEPFLAFLNILSNLSPISVEALKLTPFGHCLTGRLLLLTYTPVHVHGYPWNPRYVTKVLALDLLSYRWAQSWGCSKLSMCKYVHVTYSCKTLIVYAFHTKSRIFNPGSQILMKIVSG